MHGTTAASLTARNLLYREPALHDELHTDSTVADEVLDVIRDAWTQVKSVLDLGCGTAHVLAEVHHRRGWLATGVDLQPAVLDHARRIHPDLELHVGDLCTVRLNKRFDLVLCVGNTLSYLHSDAELAAAFDTMAAHGHSGTVIVISTLGAPGGDAHSTCRVTSKLVGGAEVTTTTRWDAGTRLLHTFRSWRFDTGRTENDHFIRRAWDTATLARHSTRVGLRSPIFLRQ